MGDAASTNAAEARRAAKQALDLEQDGDLPGAVEMYRLAGHHMLESKDPQFKEMVGQCFGRAAKLEKQLQADAQRVASAPPVQQRLPDGWERRFTDDGRPYYAHHETRTTQWERPT